ncbi:MAG: hypothetical protein AAB152_16620 [Candidatus Coatesbacteria bacterium]
MLAVACALPRPSAAAPAVPAGSPALQPLRAGTGTATEYKHGAGIRANVAGTVLISPLRVVLRTTPALPMPGDKAVISFTVSNAGAVALTGVRPVLTFLSGSAYAGPMAGPVPAAGASIPPNGGLTFVWTVTIGGTGEIAVRAYVSATVTGQGAVWAAAERPLAPPGLPRFSASLSPNPLEVTAGQWFDVVVTVSNTGGVRAMQVLPSIPTSSSNLVAFKSGPVPAKPAGLAPGEAARFAFTFSANGSGTVSFSATVAGQADLTPPGLASRAAVTAAEKKERLVAWAQETRASATTWMDRTFNPPKPPPPTERAFMACERADDLAWETDGFATLALSSTHMTEGEHACAVTFSVPGDLTLTGTGAFKPAIRLVWPARALGHPLTPRDWTPFRSFRVDAWNASAGPLALSFSLVDSRGYRYDSLRTLAPASATRLEYSFQDMRESRIDLSRLSVLEFAVDTTALAVRPALILDNLRFELPPPPPPKRRAPSSTVMASSGAGASATVTGTAASPK